MLWVLALSKYISESEKTEHFRFKVGLLYTLQTYNRDIISELV